MLSAGTVQVNKRNPIPLQLSDPDAGPVAPELIL